MSTNTKTKKELSVRLNSSIRDQILSDVLKHRYYKQARSLNQRAIRLADVWYEHVHGGPEGVERIESLPKGWMQSTSVIRMATQEGGNSHYAHTRDITVIFDKGFSRLATIFSKNTYNTTDIMDEWKIRPPLGSMSSSRPVMYRFNNYYKLPHDGPLGKRLLKLHADITNFKELFKESRTKLQTALKSFNTLKKLEESWPDLAPFLDKHRVYEGTPKTHKPRNTLPALPIRDLNFDLGLPV